MHGASCAADSKDVQHRAQILSVTAAKDVAAVHKSFVNQILPYAVGMLAEMLAAGLNANLGGRDQIPVEVERQVLEWVRGSSPGPRRPCCLGLVTAPHQAFCRFKRASRMLSSLCKA